VKRIFELTKPEQRVVILIVAALVAIAFARHWFETKPQPPTSATSISASPTATPTILRTQQESDSDD